MVRSLKIIISSIIIVFSFLISFLIVSLITRFLQMLFVYLLFSFVIIVCVSILYYGYEKKQLSLAAFEVLVVILAISSIYLYIRVDTLENQVFSLEVPHLYAVDWSYSPSHFQEDEQFFTNVTITGAVFNSGTYDATNTTITFQVWQWNESERKDTVTYSKQVNIGIVASKSYITFDTNFIFTKAHPLAGYSITHTYSWD